MGRSWLVTIVYRRKLHTWRARGRLETVPDFGANAWHFRPAEGVTPSAGIRSSVCSRHYVPVPWTSFFRPRGYTPRYTKRRCVWRVGFPVLYTLYTDGTIRRRHICAPLNINTRGNSSGGEWIRELKENSHKANEFAGSMKKTFDIFMHIEALRLTAKSVFRAANISPANALHYPSFSKLVHFNIIFLVIIWWTHKSDDLFSHAFYRKIIPLHFSSL